MSSSEEAIVGASVWITVILYGTASNLVVITRELTGLYPMSAFLVLSLSNIPTPVTCVLSSSDQMKSLFEVSPFPVQRTSEVPTISYLNLFISFLRSSSFPVVYSVLTFHVPTVSVFFAIFSFSVAFVLVSFPVSNFSILPWSPGRGRGPCFTGRRPSWHVFLLFIFMVGFYHLFLFPNSGICTPFCSTLHFEIWTSDRHKISEWEIVVRFPCLLNFLHPSYYGWRIRRQSRMSDLSGIITWLLIPRFDLSN